ncbi:MAG TPA: hypothetical protein DCY24_03080 [Rikenellaceae bacterium]|nr:hypothetical protein [Rikenellaceae bacterium]
MTERIRGHDSYRLKGKDEEKVWLSLRAFFIRVFLLHLQGWSRLDKGGQGKSFPDGMENCPQDGEG